MLQHVVIHTPGRGPEDLRSAFPAVRGAQRATVAGDGRGPENPSRQQHNISSHMLPYPAIAGPSCHQRGTRQSTRSGTPAGCHSNSNAIRLMPEGRIGDNHWEGTANAPRLTAKGCIAGNAGATGEARETKTQGPQQGAENPRTAGRGPKNLKRGEDPRTSSPISPKIEPM